MLPKEDGSFSLEDKYNVKHISHEEVSTPKEDSTSHVEKIVVIITLSYVPEQCDLQKGKNYRGDKFTPESLVFSLDDRLVAFK